MDKYEYKIRAEEIYNLIAEQEYAQAVEIADSIDWRRVKSIKTLCTISDLYKINRRYQESKEILLMAYERYPGGRLIVYSLCELSIKLEEYVQAIEYYKEYVQLAPKDTGRYILQYRLYEAQDVTLEERIEVLEEFKRKDYRDKWVYELAYLYHRMGLISKCIDECDDLIVTLGSGKYVIKAMELKMLHQPLSASEQAKYDAWIKERDEGIAEDRVSVNYESSTSDVPNSTDEQDIGSAPTTEMPQDLDIQVKTVDVGQYNTMNLQEALAESMKDLWTGEEAQMPSSPEEDVEDNTIFGTSPMAGPKYAEDPESFNVDNWDNTGELPESVGNEKAPEIELPKVEAIDIPVEMSNRDYNINDVGEDILNEETKRIPSEAVVDYLSAQKIVAQMQQESASFVAAGNQADAVPGAITGQIDPISSGDSQFDQMLAQEYDGQIRLALSEKEQVEKQITGQLSIEDIMAEWEQTKKDNEEKRKQEVRQRILQHTGSLFDEFDEDTRAGLLAQLEQAFREAIDKEAKNGLGDSEELDEKIKAEARRAVAYFAVGGTAKEAEESLGASDEIEVQEADEVVDTPEETPEEIDESESVDDESEEIVDESDDASEEDEEIVDTEDSESVESEDIEDAAEVKAVMEALSEDEEHEPEDSTTLKVSDEVIADAEDTDRVLSDEEKEEFDGFLNSRSTIRQITSAIDNMSLASYTGNIIVTGEEGTGTISLVGKLLEHLRDTEENFTGPVGKIEGKKFNDKDTAETIDKFKNGALVIEKARGMKKSTVEKLLKALDKEDMGIMVILEDTAEGIDRIAKAIPQLTTIFNVRIDLRALDDKALVSYAREYALSREYSIDEFGVLALHTRIEEMQTSDHQVTVAEVRELVEDAIYFAEKKNPKHLFDIVLRKRYDENDMVILREKDFMHY